MVSMVPVYGVYVAHGAHSVHGAHGAQGARVPMVSMVPMHKHKGVGRSPGVEWPYIEATQQPRICFRALCRKNF